MKRILIILTTIFLIGCEEDPTMYTLTVSSNPTEGGTINPSSGEYQEGTEVTLRVNTNTNYEFDKWSGSWSGSESPLTIIMDSNKNIVGNFKLMDSDGDGITDDVDTCPDTPSGETVDENGCIPNPLYLDSNGVTIKSYDWGEVGDTGEVNGVTYTIVSKQQLRDMVLNNEDLSKICTSKIYDLTDLFFSWEGDEMIIHEINGDISNWDVSNVTDMDSMFIRSEFNGDISNWDVSNVTSMNYMFSQSLFNNDISKWDVSSVTEMNGMFDQSLFNNDISKWDVSSVTEMNGLFVNSQFNGDISDWDVSNVTLMRGVFERSKFNRNISNWVVSNVTDMYRMFTRSEFNGDISNWDVSNVTSMNYMFSQSLFNNDISKWDVSSVTEMNGMFYDSSFNNDISDWDVSGVTKMRVMFLSNHVFNQNISSWNVTNVTDCSSFSGDTPQWTLPKPNFTNCNPD